jgi:hypothetical protein
MCIFIIILSCDVHPSFSLIVVVFFTLEEMNMDNRI